MAGKKLTERQIAYILGRFRKNPALTYADFARQYNMTTPGMRQLILRRMPKLDPDWKHKNTERRWRICDECGADWQETNIYCGMDRRFCPDHRNTTAKRDGAGRFARVYTDQR